MTRRQYPPPKKRPYIGVSAFTDPVHAREMLALLVAHGCDRLLMIGVLASRRSCLGLEQEPATRHPPPESFPLIFQDHPLALNLIHYYTDRLEDLGAQLSAVTSFGGSYLDGFQLNVSWPPPSELAAFRAERPKMRLVLQIGAPEASGSTPPGGSPAAYGSTTGSRTTCSSTRAAGPDSPSMPGGRGPTWRRWRKAGSASASRAAWAPAASTLSSPC